VLYKLLPPKVWFKKNWHAPFGWNIRIAWNAIPLKNNSNPFSIFLSKSIP
jgi:hypothetical protein